VKVWPAALLLVAACGKNRAVQAVEELAQAVCACADRACADDLIAKAAERFATELAEARGTEADVQAIQAAEARIAACKKKLP
jgi:hypothetical protein